MKISILGAGDMGAGLACLWARAGHEVTISSRTPSTAVAVASRTSYGVRVSTLRQAAESADVIALATRFEAIDAVLAQTGDLEGRVVIDMTHPFGHDGDGHATRLVSPDASASSWLAARVPKARIVKAFSTVQARFLTPGAQRCDGLPLAVYYCGDDAAARRAVGELISDSGFAPVDIGLLRHAGELEPGGRLYRVGLVNARAARELSALHLARNSWAA